MFGGRGYGSSLFEQACAMWSYGHGPFALFWVLILILLVIAAIYFISKKRNYSADNEILESLKRRYVEGIITEEEYVQKRNVLTNKKHL